jgi:hypothetical protein
MIYGPKLALRLHLPECCKFDSTRVLTAPVIFAKLDPKLEFRSWLVAAKRTG